MKVQNLRKRYITLIEMMIVMFLIAMITGVIAFNYTGSLEEGKAFKTKNGMEKIHTILDLYMASNPDGSVDQWQTIVKNSPLVKNGDEIIKDGWGVPYEVSVGENHELEIKSQKYSEYVARKGNASLFKKDSR